MNCSSYGDFAFVYDKLTDDVEYEKRIDFIEKIIDIHFGKKPEILCDLGCGTGTVCKIMNDRGYDCIGIDSSESMLSVAATKNTDNRILFLNQDITDFELYGTVDVFLCLLDTVNYICNQDELEKMFGLIYNYLNPDGIFIFDVNTFFKFTEVLGNNTYVFEKDNIFYTWENYYEEGNLEFYLNFFVSEGEDGAYKRFSEQHFQRFYSMDTLSELAIQAGLSVEAFYSDMSFEKPGDGEERMYIVLKKINKRIKT